MACVIVSNVTSVTQNPSARECECEVLTANIDFIYHCIETGCQISHRSQYLVQNLRHPRSQATLPDRIHPVCTVLYCTVMYWPDLYCTVLYFTVLYCCTVPALSSSECRKETRLARSTEVLPDSTHSATTCDYTRVIVVTNVSLKLRV